MTLEQLAIFIAVAEREHLTRAADAIHLTPSAVSSAIKNLEQHYGVELFHRVASRGMNRDRPGRAVGCAGRSAATGSSMPRLQRSRS